MDKNEERVRNTTLAQLWNDEIIDRERIDTGEMSEAEARERALFWHQAAELYRDRARQMGQWVSTCRKPSPPRGALVKCQNGGAARAPPLLSKDQTRRIA